MVDIAQNVITGLVKKFMSMRPGCCGQVITAKTAVGEQRVWVPLLTKTLEFLMRSLVEVIDRIGEIEPGSIQKLKSVRDSALFGAPESQPNYWREAATILQDNFPDRFDIANVFVNGLGRKEQ